MIVAFWQLTVTMHASLNESYRLRRWDIVPDLLDQLLTVNPDLLLPFGSFKERSLPDRMSSLLGWNCTAIVGLQFWSKLSPYTCYCFLSCLIHFPKILPVKQELLSQFSYLPWNTCVNVLKTVIDTLHWFLFTSNCLYLLTQHLTNYRLGQKLAPINRCLRWYVPNGHVFLICERIIVLE